MPAERAGVSDDAALGGKLRLLQPRRGHRFGHDAILLAAAVPAQSGERAVELGSGVGAAGLALLVRVQRLHVTLVENDRALSALASENIARNGFSEWARALTLDVAAPARAFAAAGLAPGKADHVLMNPPFNDPALQSSPDRLRRAAHRATPATLPRWLGTAMRLLKPRGMLTLIWRSDGLAAALAALQPGYGAIAVLPVHPAPDKPAIRIILRARKGSRAPLAILPGFVLNEAANCPSAMADAVLRGARALPLAQTAT